MGDVILCGDFNARTGTLDDFTHVDAFLNEGNLSTITVSKRFSRDLNTNCYGTSLVELCIENNLFALNGRTKGDLTGQFTCNTYNGSSVVDYAIVAQELFPLINSFTVDYPNEFSHHSCLIFEMKIKTPKHPNVNIDVLNKPISFVWDKTKKQDLYDAVRFEDTVNKLEALFWEHNDADSSLVDIDVIVNNFSEVLRKSSLKILKRKRQINRNKNKKQGQKWYDENCHTLKKNLRNLGKLLSKYPNDPFLRHIFFAKRKEYKKLIKKMKRKFHNSMLEKIQNLSDRNPNEFWKLVNTIKTNKSSGACNEISPTEWCGQKEYFLQVGLIATLSQHINREIHLTLVIIKEYVSVVAWGNFSPNNEYSFK